MKIKQICEMTGLTDRAIRFYIEEGLITPRYTENYLGRKSFDFTDADAEQLQSIATLRKFGFTVEEIRRILADPQESIAVISDVRRRKEETVARETENLSAIARLEAEKAYTVAELAEKLQEPVKEANVPEEDRWLTWKDKLKSVLKALPIWVVMLGPVLLMAGVIIDGMLDFRFFHMEVSWRGILLGLLPTIVVGGLMLLGRFVKVRYDVMLVAALLGLLYFLPWGFIFCAFSMDSYSETEDIAHYRQVDKLFFWNETEEALFPQQAGENGRYYYYCGYDAYQSLYAEWVLPSEALEAEVARVMALLPREKGYQQVRHGSYTCRSSDSGWSQPDTAFQPESGRHAVTFFAYDPQTGVVRYILCEERTGDDDPPYYMTLPW